LFPNSPHHERIFANQEIGQALPKQLRPATRPLQDRPRRHPYGPSKSTAWRPVSCPQSGKSTSRNGPSAVFQGGEPQLGLLSVGAGNNRRYQPARCSRACWPGAPGLPSLEIADGESLPLCLLECVLFIARATEYGKFGKHGPRTTAASVLG